MDEEAQRAAARARQLQAEAEEERLAAEEAEKAEKQVGGPVFMTQQEASDFSASRVDLLQRARAGDQEAAQQLGPAELSRLAKADKARNEAIRTKQVTEQMKQEKEQMRQEQMRLREEQLRKIKEQKEQMKLQQQEQRRLRDEQQRLKKLAQQGQPPRFLQHVPEASMQAYAAEVTPSWPAARKKPLKCKFYGTARGCLKGGACPFVHAEGDDRAHGSLSMANLIAHDRASRPSRGAARRTEDDGTSEASWFTSRWLPDDLFSEPGSTPCGGWGTSAKAAYSAEQPRGLGAGGPTVPSCAVMPQAQQAPACAVMQRAGPSCGGGHHAQPPPYGRGRGECCESATQDCEGVVADVTPSSVLDFWGQGAPR